MTGTGFTNTSECRVNDIVRSTTILSDTTAICDVAGMLGSLLISFEDPINLFRALEGYVVSVSQVPVVVSQQIVWNEPNVDIQILGEGFTNEVNIFLFPDGVRR